MIIFTIQNVAWPNYYKSIDFNFEIVNFRFLDGDVPRSPSYGVYISQLILECALMLITSTTETYF